MVWQLHCPAQAAAQLAPAYCNAFSGSTATGTGFPSGSNDATMKDTVNTYMARVRYAAIPNQLDFDLGYTLSIANSSTAINPGPFASLSNDPVPPKAR